MDLGQFRKMTEHLPDDVELISTSDNYEMKNNLVAARVETVKVRKELKEFRDDFDGTRYSSEVYVRDENGKEALKF